MPRALEPWSWSSILALGLLAGTACEPAGVAAQESIMIDGVRAELHLGLEWNAAIGLGARFDIPIVPGGFIHDLTDELALSPGAELYFDDHGDGELSIGGVLAAQWNFYLNPEWSVFPELGLTLIFRDRDRGADLVLRPLFAGGVRYHFGRRNALLLRLAWPYGVQLGITF